MDTLTFFYEPVVVVAYWIVIKEVERRGGDLISFYEPLVVVAYYMIIMKEVALKGEVETFGGGRRRPSSSSRVV